MSNYMVDSFRSLDLPGFPGTQSVSEMLGFALFPMRAAAIALGSFGLLAIVLAITGIHALASYAVAQRSRELGIRMALGARPVAVMQLVMRKLAFVSAGGIVLGALLALAATPAMRAVVYGVSLQDTKTFAWVLALLVAASALSCWRPLLRALRTDPATTLRCE
jgi:putative ABC transport system permease protein